MSVQAIGDFEILNHTIPVPPFDTDPSECLTLFAILVIIEAPPIITLKMLAAEADKLAADPRAAYLARWLRHRHSNGQIKDRLRRVGYHKVWNPSSRVGEWELPDGGAMLYARMDLDRPQAMRAAETFYRTAHGRQFDASHNPSS